MLMIENLVSDVDVILKYNYDCEHQRTEPGKK